MEVTFRINYHATWGQQMYIVGSIPQLGLWEEMSARELQYVGDGNWELQLDVPSDVSFIEYAYFLRINDRRIPEDWNRYHCLALNRSSERYIVYDHWYTKPKDLCFYSSAFTKNIFAHPAPFSEQSHCCNQRVIINVFAPRVEKDQVVIMTGNREAFGNWDPDKGIELSRDTFPEWHIDLDMAEFTYPLEYKFLIKSKTEPSRYLWEEGENRFLALSTQEENVDTVVVSGLFFRKEFPLWRCAGTVIPLFSLRSEESFGVGDLGDLYKMVDWVRKTDQHFLQILPINDTTNTHSWKDSYPYSAISNYAIHPMYICLPWLNALRDEEKSAFYESIRYELNEKADVDYENVNSYKLRWLRDYFEQEAETVLTSSAFELFFAQNKDWLVSYAAYCYLRDKKGTADFSHWGVDSVYDEVRIQHLTERDGEAWRDISFFYFVQYLLHVQCKAVSEYARKNNVVLKGDLPIGVSRASVEVWTEPHYFNLQAQAGAPPDDFSVIGQNWKFPTYNWDVMKKDHYAWWRKRFQRLNDFFDAFRIDHILGFFRIWEIPVDYVQGLCGRFNPALPLTREEIESFGFCFDEKRCTTPRIHRCYLIDIFGAYAEDAECSYLTQSAQSTAEYLILKPTVCTQQAIQAVFPDCADERSRVIKEGLLAIANETLFLSDSYEKEKYHPRISASSSFAYRELSESDRKAFDHLYWDFYYQRQNTFWKDNAIEKLTPLVGSTEMLVCGEDLGMIPQSVPEVMNELQILSLEIERMPKTMHREFTDLQHLPYRSVCTTSTHDMSPLRNWWKEDREKTQRYYTNVLQRPGVAPEECHAELAKQIIFNHLASPSMLAIFPLQDWLAIDDSVRRSDIASERINVPANPEQYWRYRMHITIEKLIKTDDLNHRIQTLLSDTGRA